MDIISAPPAILPFITLTGADERTDVSELAKLYAEIGFLYTTTPEGRNRYPRWEWIRETSLCMRAASLHICGRGARKLLIEGKLAVSGFQRLQINGMLSADELLHFCAMYPRHTIITQHNSANAHLKDVQADNHVLLVDNSGGLGISPDSWIPPKTSKRVGFAGGLGPDNLAHELRHIQAASRRGWSVDMESKLRVDDRFSISLAAQCLSIFHNRHTLTPIS